ncbi:MAG: molybdopterin-binding oxidoreductase, partial [Nocardioidaceae bacterium]
AQHTGIATVEVRVDDGPWREARLAAEDSTVTWRQWVYDWDAKPGDHTIEVRATDKSGYTQTAHRAPPRPDGATGLQSVAVSVG